MEVSRLDSRFLMFCDHIKGLHEEKSLENLKQPFGKNSPSRTDFSFGLVNLDEAGGVSTISTDAAHQRLL